ncbi:T9SS type A sorting domain-containing protein, partial [Carboxylicivirga linearis]
PIVTEVSITVANANGDILATYTDSAVEGDGNRVDVSLGSYDDGDYTITLSEENSSDFCVVSKNERLPISILDYSPNPTEDIVAITYYSPIVTEVSITVANANGDVLATYTDSAIEGEGNQVDVSLGSYEAGNYTITLSEENSSDFCVVTRYVNNPPSGDLEIISYNSEVKDMLNIEYLSQTTTLVGLNIYDSNNDVEIEAEDSAVQGSNKIELDLQELSPGEYSFKLFNDKSEIIKSFTKLSSDKPIEFKIISADPDPTIDWVTITFTIDKEGMIEYEISGEDIIPISTNYPVGRGENKLPIDLRGGDFPAGEYTIVLKSGDKKISKSVIKQAQY